MFALVAPCALLSQFSRGEALPALVGQVPPLSEPMAPGLASIRVANWSLSAVSSSWEGLAQC